ncbi:MAG: four helix bundle protein [FCB group bacterium]|jgi:four helix bundle protein
MDKTNNLYVKSLDLAKEIILLYRELDKKLFEKEITKQFLRSGTSVGANVAEAQGSISEPDYIAKIHIAYKELLETEYWIDLLLATDSITQEKADTILQKTNELSKILYTIIKNIRAKTKSKI